ncbi:hypothetical protein IP69_21060 [Bosea sp. AAP35]|nr:hypothetical protein IP69_21060 [Bosea sp. AAP35]
MQDGDGAGPLLAASRRSFPFIEKVLRRTLQLLKQEADDFGQCLDWLTRSKRDHILVSKIPLLMLCIKRGRHWTRFII